MILKPEAIDIGQINHEYKFLHLTFDSKSVSRNKFKKLLACK